VVVAGARNEEVAAPITDDFFVRFFNRYYPAGEPASGQASGDAPSSLARFTGEYRGNEVPNTTIEKFFVGMLFSKSDAQVSLGPEGKLLFHPPMAEAVPLTWAGGHHFPGKRWQARNVCELRGGAGR
jgi:hypothetical protein